MQIYLLQLKNIEFFWEKNNEIFFFKNIYFASGHGRTMAGDRLNAPAAAPSSPTLRTTSVHFGLHRLYGMTSSLSYHRVVYTTVASGWAGSPFPFAPHATLFYYYCAALLYHKVLFFSIFPFLSRSLVSAEHSTMILSI